MTRRDKSDSQANAEALARRGLPFTEAHQVSVSLSQDYRRRQPATLREAVRIVRMAYQDEVPAKLHSGSDLADDGTPAWTNTATSYIFGNAQQTDAGKPKEGEDVPAVAFYPAPFRARLDGMERGDEAGRAHAAIVRHVTIGSMEPVAAAMKERVPVWCAGAVAMIALSSFLSGLSDVSVNVARRTDAA